VIAFRDWLEVHRGASASTRWLYSRDAAELFKALGEHVGKWTVRDVRDFVPNRAGEGRAPGTQKLITSLRAFLRYLSFTGESAKILPSPFPPSQVGGWPGYRAVCLKKS